MCETVQQRMLCLLRPAAAAREGRWEEGPTLGTPAPMLGVSPTAGRCQQPTGGRVLSGQVRQRASQPAGIKVGVAAAAQRATLHAQLEEGQTGRGLVEPPDPPPATPPQPPRFQTLRHMAATALAASTPHPTPPHHHHHPPAGK